MYTPRHDIDPAHFNRKKKTVKRTTKAAAAARLAAMTYSAAVRSDLHESMAQKSMSAGGEQKLDKISVNIGKLIVQGRMAKDLNQHELATKICEKQELVADYEAGRCIPKDVILAKIERVIDIKLRGSDRGIPLEPTIRRSDIIANSMRSCAIAARQNAQNAQAKRKQT